ncbi:MAG: GumC family protein [Muribaculaceae bacterium]
MEENDSIDLRKYIATAKRGWYWYATSLVIFLALAIFYHFYHMDQYMTHAQILIEEDEDSGGASSAMSGGMASLMRSFSIGGFGSASVDNELLIFQSHNMLVRLVQDLKLNYTYIERQGIKKQNLYDESPIMITAKQEMLDTLRIGMIFNVHLKADGKADVEVVKGFFKKQIAKSQNVSLPTVITTPYGNFQLLKSKHYLANEERDIKVMVCGTELAVYDINKLLEVDYSSKKGDGIYLGIKTTNQQHGKDVLNGMMNIYNDIRLSRKNDQAGQKLAFYDKMIEEITTSLTQSEQKMQDFQTQNNVVLPETEAVYSFSSDKEAEKEIIRLRDQIASYDVLLKILNDPAKKDELLPVGDDNTATPTVAKYNELILFKRKLEQSATAENINLKQTIVQINELRTLVIENLQLVKQNAQKVVASLSGLKSTSKARLSKAPSYQREYLNLYRDKELKNDLYVFLLEKRYNSAMTLSSNFPRGFIIDPAYCDIKPMLKKSLIGFAGCLFMGLLIPTIYVCIVANRKPKNQEEGEEENNVETEEA